MEDITQRMDKAEARLAAIEAAQAKQSAPVDLTPVNNRLTALEAFVSSVKAGVAKAFSGSWQGIR
jgi:hypothetical protein